MSIICEILAFLSEFRVIDGCFRSSHEFELFIINLLLSVLMKI